MQTRIRTHRTQRLATLISPPLNQPSPSPPSLPGFISLPDTPTLEIGIAWESCYIGTMIVSFKDQGTEDIFNGKNTKVARKICSSHLWKIAIRKLDQLDSVIALDELRIPPGNRLEWLIGSRKDQHSIRINEQYRICFSWTTSGPEHVEIVDYH